MVNHPGLRSTVLDRISRFTVYKNILSEASLLHCRHSLNGLTSNMHSTKSSILFNLKGFYKVNKNNFDVM